jgi:putative ABC transport system permease protein
MYIPHAQSPVEDMSLIVRSQLPPENLVGDIQREVRELDPSLPVFDLSTLEEIRASSLASPRFQTFLFGAFAVITLFLAALGIFGLVSYRVSGQTSEIGVRRALGARDVQILAMVLRHSLLPAFSGLIVGLIGSLLLAGLIETLLYQVAPHDALTLLTLSGALLLTAVLATLQPALQALRVVPLIALRGDQQN